MKQNRIALQGTNGLLLIQESEILYALAAGNYTQVHLVGNRKVKVLRKLKEVSQLLSHENFVRIHRSHLINLEHATQFDQKGIETVLLTNGEALPVARNRRNHFIQCFTKI